VKNEQVRLLLRNIDHNATQLTETTSDEHKLSLYESMMKTLVEAQQILRDEYKDDPVGSRHFTLFSNACTKNTCMELLFFAGVYKDQSGRWFTKLLLLLVIHQSIAGVR